MGEVQAVHGLRRLRNQASGSRFKGLGHGPTCELPDPVVGDSGVIGSLVAHTSSKMLIIQASIVLRCYNSRDKVSRP